MAIKLSDLLGIGLLIFSVWLFLTSINQVIFLLRVFGVISSIIIFIVELIFIVQKLSER